MDDIRNDYVAMRLRDRGIERENVNPARGIPMPDNPDEYDALLIYGGIQSANDGPEKPYIADELEWISKWLDDGRPTLGLCLGAQLVAKSLGATVGKHPDGIMEIGFHKITPTAAADEFLPAPAHFYQWHGEGFTLPEGCELLAEGEQFPNQAYRYGNNTYGFQFHPEVTRTIMQDWMSSAGHMLSVNGAHGADQQLTDESRYGTDMGNWCQNFVDRWIDTW